MDRGGQTNDDVLVERARSGDYDAFEALVRKHQGRTFAVALGMVKNEAEAEEIVQETFLSAFQKLDSFRSEAMFSTWLYRVTMNHCLMRLRKKRPTTVSDASVLETHAAARGLAIAGDAPRAPDAQLDARRLNTAMESALAALSDDARAVLLLRAFDGLSNQETAAILNETVPTVKSRLHRARLQLKDALEPFLDNS